jgi:rare lipoprotein A
MACAVCRVLAVSLAILAAGCHRGHRPTAPSSQLPPAPSPTTPGPARPSPPSTPSAPAVPIIQGEQGLASWYGHPYHGRPTTNGEIYNMYELTAAHRTLPFNTQVRVHDLDNGRDVTVRINDRGPFVEGRIIDLSYAGARAINMIGPGVARVQLEILGLPPPGSPGAEPGVYAVQVGAFRNWGNAERLQARVSSSFNPVIIQSFDRGDGLYHRVRVGHEATEDGARQLALQLREAGLATETFVVRLN